MAGINKPEEYEAWYHSSRGQWIGETEFTAIMKQMQPAKNSSLLDVGSGTGYFSRLFSNVGIQVNGIDPSYEAIQYARRIDYSINYVQGSVLTLPFVNNSFDYCTAITSLCFVDNVEQAMKEMWRVARKSIVLGLLNRHSLLYINKHLKNSYMGARWDSWHDVEAWEKDMRPAPASMYYRTAVFSPLGGFVSRFVESVTPGVIPWGGFLIVMCKK